MTATISTAITSAPTAAASAPRPTTRRAVARTIAVATLVAAAAVELLVALVKSAGAEVAIQGKPLGFGGCTIALLMCMVPAVAVIAGVRRWAAHPTRAWVRITVALTAVSFVPDLTVSSTSTGSRLTLMTAHLVAAAIIVPLVARRLPTSR
ncbi:MAG: DUF6069 family protein [Jatrophihabitans sp.]|uniref:DUF6069 family protein n=1 Tax=Jatrophihabitans sp. TaxID=1932789 RepID=UPI0039121772